jgi:hypothetical protein
VTTEIIKTPEKQQSVKTPPVNEELEESEDSEEALMRHMGLPAGFK